MTDHEQHVHSDPTASVPMQYIVLPIILLAASLLVILIWQLNISANQKTAARNAQVQRMEMVKQSRTVQASLERLANDVLELAKTDTEAKTVVEKFGIRKGQEGPPQAPAPEIK